MCHLDLGRIKFSDLYQLLDHVIFYLLVGFSMVSSALSKIFEEPLSRMEAAISSVALGLFGDPLLFDEDSAQLSIIEKSSICPDGCLHLIVIPGG